MLAAALALTLAVAAGFAGGLACFVADLPAGFVSFLDSLEPISRSAVIAMGHALGLEVIAEGVEHPEQMQFLREHDCDVCQGYLFSRPTTAAEITRMRRG